MHATIFTVTDAPGPAIVGCKKCKELDLIYVNCSLELSEEKGVYTPLTSKSLISDLWGARNFSHEKMRQTWTLRHENNRRSSSPVMQSFSIIDAKKGYWHVPLDKVCYWRRHLTAPSAGIALRDSSSAWLEGARHHPGRSAGRHRNCRWQLRLLTHREKHDEHLLWWREPERKELSLTLIMTGYS